MFLIDPYRFGVRDPYFSNVSLLLHGDGTNGSTTITDSSPSPKTVTAVGNAQISTAQSKFGGASLAFDGTGDYLSLALSSDFAFPADLTVEAWLYLAGLNSVSNASYITDFRSNDSSNFTFGIINNNGEGRMYAFVNGVDSIGSNAVALNTWQHLAYVRSGTTVTLYLNGTANGTLTSSVSQASSSVIIGARFNGLTEYVNGYIDDLRITKGVARYTANFTPPTAPFPDA